MEENYWMGTGQQKVHWTLKVNKAFLGEKAQFGPKKPNDWKWRSEKGFSCTCGQMVRSYGKQHARGALVGRRETGLSATWNPCLRKTNGFLCWFWQTSFPLSDRVVIYDLAVNSWVREWLEINTSIHLGRMDNRAKRGSNLLSFACLPDWFSLN